MWVPMLGEGSVYISELSYENTEANRDQILALITHKFHLAAFPVEVSATGHPYFIESGK
jgi:hypothetical protein